MNKRGSEFAVGIFIILFGAALFFLAMKVSGLIGTNVKDPYQMTATFHNVNGLKPRAKVTLSGVTVGRVTDIQLDPVTRLATVYMTLDGSLTSFNSKQLEQVKASAIEDLRYSSEYENATAEQQKEMETQLLNNMTSITNIDEDAYIIISTNGLLGEKYLRITPGGHYRYLKRGGEFINKQGSVELEDLINKFITNGGASKLGGDDTKAQNSDSKTSSQDDVPSFEE